MEVVADGLWTGTKRGAVVAVVLDGLIAATVGDNGRIVVTRRSGDVAIAGARVLNPWPVA